MLLRSLVAAGVLIGICVAPVAGTERETLPAEPATIALPGTAAQVVAVDLDADGAREIVRLRSTNGPEAIVDAMRSNGSEWGSIGESLVAGETFRLLVWRDGNRERAAIVEASAPATPGCCTGIAAVEMDAGRLIVRPLADSLEPAHATVAVDLDGDGTDELVLAHEGRITAMAWSGEHFAALAAVDILRGNRQTPMALGNSDGEPGDEAILVEGGGAGTSAGGFLVRVALDADGRLRADTESFTGGAPSETGVAGIEDGEGARLVIVGSNRTQVGRVARGWPAPSRVDGRDRRPARGRAGRRELRPPPHRR